MSRSNTLPALAVALSCTVYGLAGCDGDGGGVTPPTNGPIVDQQVAQAVDSIFNTFFGDNEGASSLNALGPIIAAITGVSSLRLDKDVSRRMRHESHPLAVDPGLVRSLTSSTARARIPTELQGVTCIWDLGLQQYVIDPNDPGLAPPNGIRFRLYTINPGTGLPASPLNDIGFLDIVDTSSGNSVNVSLLVDIGGVPVLDYSVTGTFSPTSFNVTAAGTASDGVSTLNFSLGFSGTPAGFTASFSLVAGTATLTVSVMLDATGAGSAAATLTSTEGVLAFVVDFDELGFISDGSVLFNEDVIAVVSGNVLSPVVTPTSGSPLSSAEAQAMAGLFVDGAAIFDNLADLATVALAIGGNTPPLSEAPTITTITFPATIGGQPNDTTFGTISFFDPDGDIVLAHVKVISSAIPFTDVDFDPGVFGQMQGDIGFFVTCTGPGTCDGGVTLQVTLEDADGNVSLPFRFTFTFVSGSLRESAGVASVGVGG